jgi:hypothetical protein
MVSQAIVIADGIHEGITGRVLELVEMLEARATSCEVVGHKVIQRCWREIGNVEEFSERVLSEPSWEGCLIQIGLGYAVNP